MRAGNLVSIWVLNYVNLFYIDLAHVDPVYVDLISIDLVCIDVACVNRDYRDSRSCRGVWVVWSRGGGDSRW